MGFAVQEAGGRAHLDYRIPAEAPNASSHAIFGRIEMVLEFRGDACTGNPPPPAKGRIFEKSSTAFIGSG